MTESAVFSVHEGRLRIDSDELSRPWEGLLDGMPVLDLVAAPGSSAAIVLLDPPAGHTPVRNLVKVGTDASVIWRAELPTSEGADCFVSLAPDEPGMVAASTWSGYRVYLSAETGQTIRKAFTK